MELLHQSIERKYIYKGEEREKKKKKKNSETEEKERPVGEVQQRRFHLLGFDYWEAN